MAKSRENGAKKDKPLSQKWVKKLKRILMEMAGEDSTITIFITQWDPDACGSAIMFRVAVKKLLEKEIPDLVVRVFYAGGISILNKSLFNIYRLNTWINPIPKDIDDLSDVVLLDSSQKDDSRTSIKYNARIVFDHHVGCDIEETEDTFVWVDPLIGACTTLVGELLQALGVEFEEDEEIQQWVTAGAIGIASDTLKFEQGTEDKRDRMIWNWFKDSCNQSDYAALLSIVRDKSILKIWNDGTNVENNHIWFQESKLIVKIGLITQEYDACLGELIDWLSQRKGCEMVMVCAPVKDKGFVVKMRSKDITEDLPTRIVEIFQSGGAKVKREKAAGGTTIFVDDPLLTPSPETEKEDIDYFVSHVLKRLREVYEEVQ